VVIEMKRVKRGFIISGLSLFLGVFLCLGTSLADPERATFKSPLVWRVDGLGDYLLPQYSPNRTYELAESIRTDGLVEGIAATWKFNGKVTLEVSADNGLHYTSVVNGVPLDLVYSGNKIKWKVKLNSDSELSEIRIAYTDTSGIVGTFGEPELSDFKFRKPVYITGSDEELFNYQVKIKVGEGEESKSSLSPFVVYCGGGIQADFEDIRFTAADGETLLPYYLESISEDNMERIAHFWVRIPQIPQQGVTIYIYYGNPRAESLSNAEDVFDFFDDFTGQELDSEKWEIQTGLEGSYEVLDSQLKLDGGEIVSKVYQLKDGIIEYQAEATSGYETRLIIRTQQQGLTQVAYSSAYEGAEHCVAVDNIVKANAPQPIAVGREYIYRVSTRGTEITFERYDETGKEKQAAVDFDDLGGLNAGYVGLKTGAGNVSYYDWLRVRRYAASEPVVSSSGEEELTNLGRFLGITLAENGNLILGEEEIEGVYTSGLIPTPYQTRIIIPRLNYQDSNSVILEISADGGATYKTDCASGLYYYASKKDFNPGNSLKFQLCFSQGKKDSSSSQVEAVSVEHNPGDILVISPNGGERWPAGGENEIIWTASQYEASYPVKIGYSLDSGRTYKLIAHKTKNDGSFLWAVPADLVTDQAMIRVTDGYDDSVRDTSDDVFSIGPFVAEPEEEAPEGALIEEEELIEEETDLDRFLEQIAKDPSATPHELLVKLTDNYHPDPGKDALSYKAGDIVVVKPAGFEWSENEKNSFLILRANLTPEAAIELVSPRKIDTGEKDEQGRPIMRSVARRKFRINLKKFDLEQKPEDEGAPPVRRFLKKEIPLQQMLRSR
jgi:hypothetical protein